MAMISSTPPSNNNNTISQKLSLENKNNLRDVSFSSYLNGAEKTFFLLKLTESTQTPSSPNLDHAYVGKKKVQDGEIGVFGAEKYFQGEMDDKNSRIATANPKHQHDKNEPQINNNIACVNPKTLPGTPSVRSESSWNSQSALLTRVPRKQSRIRKRSKVYGRSFLSNIGCNCYCNDKNSVDIDEDRATKSEVSVRPNKSLSKTWAEEEMNIKKIDEKGIGVLNREDIFSFPILANANPQKEDDKNNDPRRSSLEVFGSPIVEKGKRSLSIERKKPSTLSWDAEEEEVEKLESLNGAYNDNESEASSDLFEIESFSTNTNSFLVRETSTCYAPSEASIDWSVVTADYEDTRNIPNRMAAKNGKDSPVRDGQKRRPGILSGCRSQKAVSVAGDAYRTNYKSIIDPRRNHGFDSLKPVTGFGSRQGEPGLDRIRSRAPNLLYI